jgi:hypothetical protein
MALLSHNDNDEEHFNKEGYDENDYPFFSLRGFSPYLI